LQLPFLACATLVRPRPRRHSLGRAPSPDFAAGRDIKRRSLHGSFAGLHDDAPVRARGSPSRVPPPAPPASRNDVFLPAAPAGFGTTYSVIPVN